MGFYVQKYGGSSLKSPDHIKKVALRISELRKEGHKMIVVVCAMGETTAYLINLAY